MTANRVYYRACTKRASCVAKRAQDLRQGAFQNTSNSWARIRGFGLPLARIYARYFGGELTLKSTEGHGLDAYLHLPRLGEACENLPLRVRDSPGERDSMPLSHSSSFTTTAATKSSSTTTSSPSSNRKTKPAGSVIRTYSTAAQTISTTTKAVSSSASTAAGKQLSAMCITNSSSTAVTATSLGL